MRLDDEYRRIGEPPPHKQLLVVDTDGSIMFIGRMTEYEIHKSGDHISFIVKADGSSDEPWL